MTLEKMQLDVITKYGHESKQAIRFCRLCEKHPKVDLRTFSKYKRLMRG